MKFFALAGAMRLLMTGLRASLILSFVVLSLPQHAAADDGPAIWKASRGEATAYIFGTIHLLKPGVPWLTPEIRSKFDAADALVIEVTGLSENDPALQGLVLQLGMYPPGDGLDSHVSEDTWADLVAAGTNIGLPEQALQRMQPWLASITLTAVGAMANGFLPQYGVDVTLERMANDAGKSVTGLETGEYQLRLFSDMPEAMQMEFLERTLEQIQDLIPLFEQMKSSWLSGDVDHLAHLMNEGFDGNHEAMDRLLLNRNRNWVRQIDEMLAEPGITFVAVGAGHLAGDGNLIELLDKEGIQVTRE